MLGRCHGSGLAQALMETAAAAAQAGGAARLLLGVHQGNARALRFYAKAGFEPVGTRRFDVSGAIYDDFILGRTLGA